MADVGLADAAGLTPIQVTRMLQNLRRDKPIELKNRTLRVPSLSALMDVAMFNQDYLHLQREGRSLDAND